MKKLFSFFTALIMVVLLFSVSKAQPLQDFESLTFPPTGWTLEYTGTQYWTRNAFTSYLPPQTGAAKFNFFSASGGTVQSIITPALVASAAGDSVKFDLSYHTYTGGEVDTLYILTSTDNGATYSTLVTLLGGPTVGTGMVTWAASSSSAAPTLASQWGAFGYALPVGTNKIKFKAASAFGNNLYIDNIKTKPLSSSIPNNIETTSIISPNGTTLTMPVTTIAPKAIFTNVGLNNQVSIPVTFKITGPVNYTNNKVIAALTAGSTTTVTFDSTFNPTVGTYNVTVYCALATDGDRTNDTLKTTFNVVDPNFGSGTGGIFYANSISVGAPSKPEVCFPDSTGGKTLCRAGVYYDTAIFSGSLDDGFWRLGGSNLGLPAGYKIRVNGVDYDSMFVSTNGYIGVTAVNGSFSDFSPEVLPTTTHGVEFYPLWKDFDLRTNAGPDSYIKVLVRGKRVHVIYQARTYNAGGISADRVYFTATFELVNSAVNSNVIYAYGDTTRGTTASFVAAVNGNTLADHVIGMQSNAAQYVAYRQRVTTITAFGPIFANASGANLAVEIGPNAANLNNKCATLNLKACLELCPSDIASVTLYNSSCGIIDVRYPTITGSTVSIDFNGVENSPTQYYIKVNQKNSLTVSSNLFSFTGYSASYDFTTGLAKVYGGTNLTFVGGKWCILTGDVNKDGTIDGGDVSAIDNDAISGVPGSVSGKPTDLNCDDFIDGGDLSGADNNAAVGYFEDVPCPGPDFVSGRIPGPFDGYQSLPEVDKRNKEDIKPVY